MLTRYPDYMVVFSTLRFKVVAPPGGGAVIQDGQLREAFFQSGDDAQAVFDLVRDMERNGLGHSEADHLLAGQFA